MFVPVLFAFGQLEHVGFPVVRKSRSTPFTQYIISLSLRHLLEMGRRYSNKSPLDRLYTQQSLKYITLINSTHSNYRA